MAMRSDHFSKVLRNGSRSFALSAVMLCAAVVLGGSPSAHAQTSVGPAKSIERAPSPVAPAASAPAATPAAQVPEVPQPEMLLMLLRTSMIALDQANKTNNYTVLRELGGPGLMQYSNAQLSEAFSALRRQNLNLGVIAVLTPQVTEPPTVSPQGLLRLVGFVPSQPHRIEFQMVFQPFQGEWRLFGMNVDAKPQVAAVADASKAEPPAAQQPAARIPVSTGAQKALAKAPAAVKQ
jgi:hypothetical protein